MSWWVINPLMLIQHNIAEMEDSNPPSSRWTIAFATLHYYYIKKILICLWTCMMKWQQKVNILPPYTVVFSTGFLIKSWLI